MLSCTSNANDGPLHPDPSRLRIYSRFVLWIYAPQRERGIHTMIARLPAWIAKRNQLAEPARIDTSESFEELIAACACWRLDAREPDRCAHTRMPVARSRSECVAGHFPFCLSPLLAPFPLHLLTYKPDSTA